MHQSYLFHSIQLFLGLSPCPGCWLVTTSKKWYFFCSSGDPNRNKTFQLPRNRHPGKEGSPHPSHNLLITNNYHHVISKNTKHLHDWQTIHTSEMPTEMRPFYIAIQVIYKKGLLPLQGYLNSDISFTNSPKIIYKNQNAKKKAAAHGFLTFHPFPSPTLSGKTPRVFFRFTEPPWPHSHHWIGQRHHRGVRSRRWQRCNLPRRSGQGRSLLGDLPDDLEMWLSWP